MNATWNDDESTDILSLASCFLTFSWSKHFSVSRTLCATPFNNEFSHCLVGLVCGN